MKRIPLKYMECACVAIVTFWLLVSCVQCAKGESLVTVKGIKPQYVLGEAITPEIDMSTVPEGAQIQPGFQFIVTTDALKYEVREPAPKTYHVWGAPGKYKISIMGMWGVPAPGDPGKWLSFGLIFQQVEFAVVEGGPVPPPPPPGKRRAVILEETADKTPQQDVLWKQLLKEFPNLQILDDDLPIARPYVSLSKLGTRPALLVLTEAGQLVRESSAPSSVDEFRKEMSR